MQLNNSSAAGSEAARNAVAERYFGATDALFVAIALVVAVMVVRLGAHTFTEGMHTEHTKAGGERIAAWIEEAGKKREAGEATGIAACDGQEASWVACRDALVADDGPLADLKNISNPGGLLFASACDRTQLDTLGAYIVEKGMPKPPDGASLMYSPIADDEPVNEPVPLRVAICGRGYAQINIREVRF
jgi:hypothetical protein